MSKAPQPFDSILDTVGNTPLVRLNRVASKVQARVYAKLENTNPGGSMKDRIALSMIEDAERSGKLEPGGIIVECTSGNTGAGLAQIAAAKGYRTIFTIPDKMSTEKVNHLKALGAEVVVTPTVPVNDPLSYQSTAKRIADSTPGAILLNQYFNPANMDAHYRTTGNEIWEQTGGKVTHFVAATGTGGTLSGTGKHLKERDPKVKVVGVDPTGSILADLFHRRTTNAAPYKIEGAGADELPGNLVFDHIDNIITVGDKRAFQMTRRLARDEGIFAGGSSGMVLVGALDLAKQLTADDVVVVVFADSGYKYLSKIYNDAWMVDNGFADDSTLEVGALLDYKPDEVPSLLVAKPEETVREVLSRMMEFSVSQMPVVRDGTQLGGLEEHHLMAQVLSNDGAIDGPVEKVMRDGFPVVSHSQTVADVRTHISDKRRPAVLVERDGQFIGIVTKSDVLALLN